MPDASPTKWHLAHTTWFFETFMLERHEPDFQPFDPGYRVLFNSYYQGVGEQHPRPQRGLITRPGLAEVLAYRAQVDERMGALLAHTTHPAIAELVELGLQHEQQHQELLLTDLKHLLSCNPTAGLPAAVAAGRVAPQPLHWCPFDGGVVDIGHCRRRFAFDNESPRHGVLLQPLLCPTGWSPTASGWLHGRRRLHRPALVDGRRLGLGTGPRHSRAAVLAAKR
jgi:hypothetical protein